MGIALRRIFRLKSDEVMGDGGKSKVKVNLPLRFN
jgi:hypothetical protein